MSTSQSRDVVIMLLDSAGDTLRAWLIRTSTDMSFDEIMFEAMPSIAPEALEICLTSEGDESGKVRFGIREADPVEDAVLYAQEVRDKGLLN